MMIYIIRNQCLGC